MIYIEIDGAKYPCSINTFVTQFGQGAIRIISPSAPLAEHGFGIYNNDKLIADMSEYTYLLREDGIVKEYTKCEEHIVPASGSISDIPVNPIAQQFAAINRRINDLTPYTATKMAYYGETEKVFYDAPTGNVSVFFDNYNGDYTINRVENRLTITFDALTEQTNITISIS